MASELRFCENCGSPLAPGVRFCEECGNPVLAAAGVALPADSVPAPTTTAPTDRPIAVVPFASTHGGFLSVLNCTLVVYPDKFVLANVPKARKSASDQTRSVIERTLEQGELEARQFWEIAAGADVVGVSRRRETVASIGVTEPPWEAYWTLAPGEVLAEDSRNQTVPRDRIVSVRGECDGDAGIDQVLVRTPDEKLAINFELGTFFIARDALFSLVASASGTPETVLGVLPAGSEPQVEGFGFQYVWHLVVTDRRIVYCMIKDEEADEMGAWLDAREQEAKGAGRDWRQGEEAGRQDAPWQRHAGIPVSRLLERDVNFFVPLPTIGEVVITAGGRRRGDQVRFSLPGSELSLTFPDGTAEYARSVLDQALPGRVR